MNGENQDDKKGKGQLTSVEEPKEKERTGKDILFNEKKECDRLCCMVMRAF